MSNLSVIEYQGIFVVDSRLIAQELGIEHHTFMKTLNKYLDRIESRFGVVRFEVDKPSEGSLGGRPEKYALLTEPQATTLMTFSKNTEQVVDCKLKLVEAFEKAKTVILNQQDHIRELELELELAKAQTQRAIAEKAVIDTRHLITATCPEPVQQRIFGYQTITQTEYRDRIIKDGELINEGDTINKTELCRRYSILTRNGKPDFAKLNRYLQKLRVTENRDAWKEQPRIQDNLELKRDFLPILDDLILNSDRQMFLGE